MGLVSLRACYRTIVARSSRRAMDTWHSQRSIDERRTHGKTATIDKIRGS